MMNVKDYIKGLLKKKRWTLSRFAIEINKVKFYAGINTKTTVQNISNFLNQVDDKHLLRPKQLVIWEKALGLSEDTLVNMVELPRSKGGLKSLEEIKKKVRNNV